MRKSDRSGGAAGRTPVPSTEDPANAQSRPFPSPLYPQNWTSKGSSRWSALGQKQTSDCNEPTPSCTPTATLGVTANKVLDFPSGPASIGFLKKNSEGLGTAAALCCAAERGIDAAHAQARRLACNGRSQLGVAEDVAGTNDHAVLLTENTDKDRDTQHAQQHSAPDPD